ncbi:MAG: zinc ribbon domain-containing protein [Candidatus Bathyarchaeia archaeon]
MKICHSCGAELPDAAAFCQVCGASTREDRGSSSSGNQVVMPKTIFYLAMIALAIMGIATIGLAMRGPTTVTNTNYVTQMQIATVSVSFTSSATMTVMSTVTVGSATTVPVGPPPIWFNQQYCGYPFNPNLCNEGPPVTVPGQITNDSSCVTLYVGTGQTYVVWNLPETLPPGAYQVYGYVYPNWPPTQPFPPYPFQKIICIGTPMWAIPPYVQSY